jgi:hypothetical protein
LDAPSSAIICSGWPIFRLLQGRGWFHCVSGWFFRRFGGIREAWSWRKPLVERLGDDSDCCDVPAEDGASRGLVIQDRLGVVAIGPWAVPPTG